MRVDGQEKTLTGYQYTLLLALAERAGRVLSREALMDLTKGSALEDFDRSIDVHISRIRAAIEAEDVDLLALSAEEAVDVGREIEGRPVTVRGDPNLLRRMIRNLLDNAERHAGGATRIEIGTDASSHALLIVEDHGEGIPEKDRERIFEPFYRADAASVGARGFGLGLAIVRQIARAHGGNVAYIALAGGGSRFVVTLPTP